MHNPQRRECYRVDGRGAERRQLSVRLEPSPGDRVVAEILDLCFKSIAIRVVLAPRAPLAIGEETRLIFDAPELDRPVGLEARVHSSDLRPERERYVLCFPNPEHLEALLPSKLFRLFNRRRGERAVITKDTTATLHAADGDALEVRLENASLFGLAASVPIALDPELAPGTPIRASLRLSSHAPPIELSGEVARANTVDERAHYGIRVDFDQSPHCEAHLDQLERFVSRACRQRRPRARRKLGNRRGALRAQLPPGRALSVDLFATDDRAVQARLQDISASGMSVLVSAAEDPEFLHGEEMTIACRLSRASAMLRVVASVRRELLVDDDVCYGLEFDPLRSQDFERIQAEIDAFVKVLLTRQKTRPTLTR